MTAVGRVVAVDGISALLVDAVARADHPIVVGVSGYGRAFDAAFDPRGHVDLIVPNP